MKSIRTKLIAYFSILIILGSGLLGFLLINRSRNVIIQQSEEALSSVAYESSRVISGRLDTQKQSLEVMAGMSEVQSMDWELQQPALKRQVENTDFLELGIVDLKGQVTYTNGDSGDGSDREYIQKALAGETNVAEPTVSALSGEVITMFAAPIEEDGKVVGALIGRRNGLALSELTADIVFGETGYAMLIDSTGKVIADRDVDRVIEGYNVVEESINAEGAEETVSFYEHALAEKSGVDAHSYAGERYHLAFEEIEGTDWRLIITVDEEEILREVTQTVKMGILAVVGILAVSITATFMIGNSIAKPLIQAVAQGEKLANLDISEDLPAEFLNREDEIGLLGRSFQEVINSLREVILEIGNSSEHVASTSQEMSATIQETTAASEEVARAIEDIAGGATQQASNTEVSSFKAVELGELIVQDGNYLNDLNQETQRVHDTVVEGLGEIDELYNIIQESRNASAEILESVQNTNASSASIGQASELITSIAEQTNLLALNASIEAARAGDAGRGFAVVAEEIRTLAEESAGSTAQIDQMVRELQSNSEESVETMETVMGLVEEQYEKVNSNQEKYTQIAEAIKASEASVGILNTSSENMDGMKDEILSGLEELAAIAEENSASTEEVSASTEEQTASMEEISGASENLANLAQDLQMIVDKFSL